MTSIAVDRLDGLSSSTAYKGPCKVATTANITLSGAQTIDSVSVVADDRVLVKDQADPRENGIYVASTGLWRRAKDFSNNRDIRQGTKLSVINGTSANREFAVTTADPVDVGTSNMTFALADELAASEAAQAGAEAALAALTFTYLDPDEDTTLSNLGGSASGIAEFKASVPRISNMVIDYAAAGDGATANDTAFGNANTAGGLHFIPKPATSYSFTSPFTTTAAAWLPDPSMTWAQLTDSGDFNMHRGRVTGGPNGANIWRFADRVFIGSAASKFAGNSTGTDGGTHWFNVSSYPGYLGVNAQLLVTSDDGPYGVVAAMRASDAGQGVIGFGSAVVADSTSRAAWGYIAELQREGTGSGVYGMEIGAKNKANNNTITPNGQSAGVFGLWLVAGGDSAFGGSATQPATAGIVFLKNGHTWNTGICFQKDSLTADEAIALSSAGVGGAHAINWYSAAGNNVFKIRSTATDAVGWRLERTDAGLFSVAHGVNLFGVIDATNAVNGMTVTGAQAGATPYLASVGSDTNIDFWLRPKGTGAVRFGTHAAIAAETVTGYITIKDSGGTSRKVAIVS